jgi:hypothetical protein
MADEKGRAKDEIRGEPGGHDDAGETAKRRAEIAERERRENRSKVARPPVLRDVFLRWL